MLGSVFNNERQRYFSAFRHQDVIGPASGLIVHAFHADTACSQGGRQLGMHETLALPGAENDDVRLGRIDLLEMRRGQLVERRHWPGYRGCFRQDKQTMVETGGIDFDAVVVIGGDGLVLLGFCGMELHGAQCRIAVRGRAVRQISAIRS